MNSRLFQIFVFVAALAIIGLGFSTDASAQRTLRNIAASTTMTASGFVSTAGTDSFVVAAGQTFTIDDAANATSIGWITLEAGAAIGFQEASAMTIGGIILKGSATIDFSNASGTGNATVTDSLYVNAGAFTLTLDHSAGTGNVKANISMAGTGGITIATAAADIKTGTTKGTIVSTANFTLTQGALAFTFIEFQMRSKNLTILNTGALTGNITTTSGNVVVSDAVAVTGTISIGTGALNLAAIGGKTLTVTKVSFTDATGIINTPNGATATITGNIENNVKMTSLGIVGATGGADILGLNGQLNLKASLKFVYSANGALAYNTITTITAVGGPDTLDFNTTLVTLKAGVVVGGDDYPVVLASTASGAYHAAGAMTAKNLVIAGDDSLTIVDTFKLTINTGDTLWLNGTVANQLKIDAHTNALADYVIVNGVLVHNEASGPAIWASAVANAGITLASGGEIILKQTTQLTTAGILLTVNGGTITADNVLAVIQDAALQAIGGSFAIKLNGTTAATGLTMDGFSAGANTVTLNAYGNNAATLTFAGAASTVTLDNAASVFSVNRPTAGTGVITVNSITSTDGSAQLKVNTAVTVSALVFSTNNKGLTMYFGGGTLNVTAYTIANTQTLTIAGPSGGTLTGAALSTLTTTSILTNTSGNVNIAVAVTVADGMTINVNESMRITGNITASGSATINIEEGKIFTYEGAVFTILAGKVWTFSAAGTNCGTFNNTNQIRLNTSTSKIVVSKPNLTINRIGSNDNGAIIDVNAAGVTIDSLNFLDTKGVTIQPEGICTAANTLGRLTINNFGIVTGAGILNIGNAAGQVDADTLQGGQITIGPTRTTNYPGLTLNVPGTFLLYNNVRMQDSTTVTVSDNAKMLGNILNTGATDSLVMNIASGKTFNYDGTVLTISTNKQLTLSGSGTFDNDATGLAISGTNSLLTFSASTYVDTVNVADNSPVIRVDASDAKITSLVAPNGFYLKFMTDGAILTITNALSITGGTLYVVGDQRGTLAGVGTSITVSGASAGFRVQNTSNLTIINKPFILGADGTLGVEKSMTLNGNLTFSGSATLDISTGVVFVYSATSLPITTGRTLTIKGGGRLDNDNNSNVELAASNAQLIFGLLGGTIDNVKYTVSGGTINVQGPSIISDFKCQGGGATTPFTSNISFGTADTLAITTFQSLTDRDQLTIGGTAAGRLTGGTITATAVGNKVVFSNSAGVTVDNAITIGKTTAGQRDSMAVTSAAGTVTTLRGTLSISATTTIDIASGKTLWYKGASTTLAADSIIFKGSGRLQNTGTIGTGALILGNTNSSLRFKGGVTVDSVVTNADNSKIVMDGGSPTITYLNTFTNSNSVDINFIAANTLTVTDTVRFADNKILTITTGPTNNGTIGGTLAGTGAIILINDGTQLINNNTAATGTTTISKPIKIGSGLVNPSIVANQNTTISGAITVVNNFTLNPASLKTATYTGGAFNVGAYTVTFSGAGTFSNLNNAIVLNNLASKLMMTGTGTIGEVTSSKASVIIDVDETSAIQKLNVSAAVDTAGAGVRFDFSVASKTLSIYKPVTLPGTSKVDIFGTGTTTVLAGFPTDTGIDSAIAFGSKDTLLVTNGNVNVSKALSLGYATADTTLGTIVSVSSSAPATTTYTGKIGLKGYTRIEKSTSKALTLNGDVSVTAASSLKETGTGDVTFNGALNLMANLTFVKVPYAAAWYSGATDYILAGLDSITATGALAPVTLSVDTTLAFNTDLKTIGSVGKTLIFTADNTDQRGIWITLPTSDNLTLIKGTIQNAGNDTLKFDTRGYITGVSSTNITVIQANSASGKIIIVANDADTLDIKNATLQATAGPLEIKSGSIALKNYSTYKVDGGTLMLPANKFTTYHVDSTTSISIVMTNTASVLTDSCQAVVGQPRHTIYVKLSGSASQVIITSTMAQGTVHNIAFSPSAIGYATRGINTDGYAITVFVNVTGNDVTGDGSFSSPYATFNKGYTASVSMGNISIAAGNYTIDATIIITKEVNFVGTKADGTTQSWTNLTTGVLDESPKITFTGTSGPIFNVKAGNVSFRGFRFDVGTASSVVAVKDTAAVLSTLAVEYNKFVGSEGKNIIVIQDSTGVNTFNIKYNEFSGTGSFSSLLISAPRRAVSNVTVSYNTIKNSGLMATIGKGAISTFTVDNNSFVDGNGLQIAKSDTAKYSGIAVTNNKFRGNVDYAFVLHSSLAKASFNGNVYAQVLVNNNQFFFPTGGSLAAVVNGLSDAAAATDYVNAENNWWGSSTGVTDVSTNVDYLPYLLVPTLSSTELIVSPVVGTYSYGMGIPVIVYTGFTGSVEFATNFSATLPTGTKSVTANTPTAVTDQTFTIYPLNTDAVTNAVITAYSADSHSIKATTNTFSLSSLVVGATGTLTAVDFPADNGGYVALKFRASPNHSGYTTVPLYKGDVAPIDYYQVFRNTTNNIATASYWGFVTATGKVTGADDTVRTVITTNGDLSGAYYWVAAVKGKLPSGTSVSGITSIEGYAPSYLAVGLGKESAEDIKLSSAPSNANYAIGAKNNVLLTADFTSDSKVNLLDFAYFVFAYTNPGEFDPLFDLSVNGVVDLVDFAQFVSQYGKSLSKSTIISDGINKNGSLELKTEQSSDNVTIKVLGKSFESLAGYGMDVVYDPKQYSFVDAQDGGFLTSDGGVAPIFLKKDDNGRISIANILSNYTDKAVTPDGDGVVAIIKLRRNGNGGGAISVENAVVVDRALKVNALANVSIAGLLPDKFELKQNYPNPFNPTTTIEVALPQNEFVTLAIYNSAGQIVKTIVSTNLTAGVYKFVWDGTNNAGMRVASGMYIYKIKAGNFTQFKKMMLIK